MCRSPTSPVSSSATTFSVPLGLAPTGYTRMMHPTGEVSACTAAKAKGIPYALSTMGTTTIEEVAATGHPNLWFQLYVTSDRRLSDPLIDRAAAAGYQTLEITIDTVVTGRRTRDLRNGLTIPPQLSPRTIVDIGRRPELLGRDAAQPGDRLRQLHGAVACRRSRVPRRHVSARCSISR